MMKKRIVVTLELVYEHAETLTVCGKQVDNPFDVGYVFSEIKHTLECSDYGVWGLRTSNGGGVSHLQLVLADDIVDE
jgi:hypothetical protein